MKKETNERRVSCRTVSGGMMVPDERYPFPECRTKPRFNRKQRNIVTLKLSFRVKRLILSSSSVVFYCQQEKNKKTKKEILWQGDKRGLINAGSILIWYQLINRFTLQETNAFIVNLENSTRKV